MYCTNCGTRLDDSARFCVTCGKPVGHARAAEPEMRPAEAFGAAGTLPPPGAPHAAEVKKLRRIMERKKIAGVCAGFAEYFAMDVILMRLIWIGLLLVPPHLGLFGYIVSWIVLPKD
jgi:phage shock protein C